MCVPTIISWSLLPTLPYWWLDSNQRFKLPATGIDGISIHWYISILSTNKDSNPTPAFQFRYSDLTSFCCAPLHHSQSRVSNLSRGATQFGSWDRRCTCITMFVVWEWNRTIGTRVFGLLALPTELPHHITCLSKLSTTYSVILRSFTHQSDSRILQSG